MSETLVKFSSKFRSQEKAEEVSSLLRRGGNQPIKAILKSEGANQEYIEILSPDWIIEKINRSKNTLNITIEGPPSGGNLDGLFLWLTSYDASLIKGQIVCTMADIEPSPFQIFNGIPIPPELDINWLVKKTPSGKDFDINQKDERGNTYLHNAAERGNISQAEIFLLLNADIKTVNDAGSTPIFTAVSQGEKDMVRFLIEKGADCSIARDFETERNETSLFGGETSSEKTMDQETVLDYAIRSWEKDIVEILSDHNAPKLRGKSLSIDLEVAKKVKEICVASRFNTIKAARISNEQKIPTFDGEDIWTWTKVARVLSLLDD